MKRTFLISTIVALICSCAPPQPKSFVQDDAHVFTKTEAGTLNDLLIAHERKTSNEVAVYTTNSYSPEASLHDYGVKLGKKLGIGKKGKDNGLLITLCVSSRQVDIAIGKGTEKVLTDEMAKLIIDSNMVPEFKKGDYYEGILSGSKAIITILERPGNEIK